MLLERSIVHIGVGVGPTCRGFSESIDHTEVITIKRLLLLVLVLVLVLIVRRSEPCIAMTTLAVIGERIIFIIEQLRVSR
jgi:hypothetical protein